MIPFESDPGPRFGPTATSVVPLDDGTVFVGGTPVRLDGPPLPSAADVAIYDAAPLGGSFALIADRGSVFLWRPGSRTLEALPIGGEPFAQDHPLAWGGDDAFYVATRSGLAYRVREDGAEAVARSRTVVRLDRAPDERGVLATVAPGRVLRVDDDGTETLVGRRPGVPTSMAMVDGVVLPEIPFAEDPPADSAEGDTTTVNLVRAHRALAHTLGYDALSGDVVSPFDVSGLDDALVGEDPFGRSRVRYRVMADGFVAVVDRALTSFDREGRMRLAANVISSQEVIFSHRSDRFLAIGCDGSRRPRYGYPNEGACLYDGNAVTEIAWSVLVERARDGSETAHELASFLVGDAIGFVVRDGASMSVVRLTPSGDVTARTLLPFHAAEDRGVHVTVAPGDGTVFVLAHTDDTPILVRIDGDGAHRVAPAPAGATSVAFADALHGVVETYGSGRSAFATSDGGQRWIEVPAFASDVGGELECSPVACIVGNHAFARADVGRRLHAPAVVHAPRSPMNRRLQYRGPYLDPPLDPRAAEVLAAVPRIALPRWFVGRELPAPDAADRWWDSGFHRLRLRSKPGTSRRTEATVFGVGEDGLSLERRLRALRLPQGVEAEDLRLVSFTGGDEVIVSARDQFFRIDSEAGARPIGGPTRSSYPEHFVHAVDRTFALHEARDGQIYFHWIGDDSTAWQPARIHVGTAGSLGRDWRDGTEVESWVAHVDAEPGILIRRGWSGPIEFFGVRGGYRAFRDLVPFRGWCSAPETAPGSVVVSAGGLLGPLSSEFDLEIKRSGLRTWELDAAGACLRRIEWTLLYDEYAPPFGVVRLEPTFDADRPTFALRYVWHDRVVDLNETSADPGAADISRGAASGCAHPPDSEDCAEPQPEVPASIVVDAAGVFELVRAPSDSEEVDDEPQLPDWVRPWGGSCGCSQCEDSYSVGTSERIGFVQSGAARAGGDGISVAWSGTAELGLFATASHAAQVDIVAIENGRPERLPRLPLTACPSSLLAVDAVTRTVLVTDCPIDESGTYVRLMRLERGAWVDRMPPLATGMSDSNLIRGAIVRDEAFVFVARGTEGDGYRSVGGAWRQAPFRWRERP